VNRTRREEKELVVDVVGFQVDVAAFPRSFSLLDAAKGSRSERELLWAVSDGRINLRREKFMEARGKDAPDRITTATLPVRYED